MMTKNALMIPLPLALLCLIILSCYASGHGRMSWRLAVQGESGRHQISVEPSQTIESLQDEIASKCGVAKSKQKLMAGFPPSDICVKFGPSKTLQEAGIQNGDMVRLGEKSKDEMASELSKLQSLTTPSGRKFKRHVVPADNSCLFRCVSLALGGKNNDGAEELRELVAAMVASDPQEHCEAVLGKANSDYCEWILNKDSWGGGIELGILSKHFCTELDAIECATSMVYRFGESENYGERCVLMYDGIHYDILAEEKGEQEVYLFGASDEEALDACRQLVRGLKEAGQFVDVSGFSLKCMVCGQGLKGAQGAQEHAAATGHTNFAENDAK